MLRATLITLAVAFTLIIGLLVWLALGTEAQMERNDNRPAAMQQD